MVHHGVTLEHDASFSHALFAFAGVQCPLACPKPAGRVPLGTVAGRQHWTFCLQMQCRCNAYKSYAKSYALVKYATVLPKSTWQGWRSIMVQSIIVNAVGCSGSVAMSPRKVHGLPFKRMQNPITVVSGFMSSLKKQKIINVRKRNGSATVGKKQNQHKVRKILQDSARF